MREKNIAFKLVIIFSCFCLAGGCETLQRKFTRKRKEETSKEQVILVPRDYAAHPFPNDVMYKQYFTYWKSWNQELITSLNDDSGHKKIMECVEQAGVNLKKMASYLNEEKARELEVYLKQTEQLRAEIEGDVSLLPSRLTAFRYRAERILSSVNRNFDLHKMKNFLR
jgi:hypothetical protein